MTVPHLTAVFVHDRAVAAVSRAIADAMAPLLDGIDTDRIGAIRQALNHASLPRHLTPRAPHVPARGNSPAGDHGRGFFFKPARNIA